MNGLEPAAAAHDKFEARTLDTSYLALLPFRFAFIVPIRVRVRVLRSYTFSVFQCGILEYSISFHEARDAMETCAPGYVEAVPAALKSQRIMISSNADVSGLSYV